MTFEEEWKELLKWFDYESSKISKKYDHSNKYQQGLPDGEEDELSNLKKELYKKIKELRKKYAK